MAHIDQIVGRGGILPIAIAPSLWISPRFIGDIAFSAYPDMSAIRDRSGNGYNFTQATAEKQPMLGIDPYINRPIIIGGGGQYLLGGNNPVYSNVNGMTVFIITNVPGGDSYIFAKDSAASHEFKLTHDFMLQTYFFTIYEDQSTASSALFQTSDYTAFLLTLWWQPGQCHKIYQNGVLKATSPVGQAVTDMDNGSSVLSLLADGDGNNSGEYLEAGDSLVFPTALGDADRSTIEKYLMNAWGL